MGLPGKPSVDRAMRRLRMMAIVGLLLLDLVTGLYAAKPPAASTLRLTVNLKDGSRIIGEPNLKDLPIRSETMGTVGIPLDKVRALKFNANHASVTVSLQ